MCRLCHKQNCQLISYYSYYIMGIVGKGGMRREVSTKGRYALRLMLDLALYGNGTCISLRDISARQNVSVKYLEQIVVILARAGFVKSVRGPQGGYRLARAAEGLHGGGDIATD